jgi:hypothetical protein
MFYVLHVQHSAMIAIGAAARHHAGMIARPLGNVHTVFIEPLVQPRSTVPPSVTTMPLKRVVSFGVSSFVKFNKYSAADRVAIAASLENKDAAAATGNPRGRAIITILTGN